MTREAKCCCGDLRIIVEGDPVINGVCHCLDCKKRTGSGFGWSVYYYDNKIIDLVGEALVYSVRGENPQQRNFCKTCGSTVFWKSSGYFAGMTGIAGGCFAGPSLPDPEITLSNENRCAWLRVPDTWKQSL